LAYCRPPPREDAHRGRRRSQWRCVVWVWYVRPTMCMSTIAADRRMMSAGGISEPGLEMRQTCLYYSGMGRTRAMASEARQRILATADRLFYEGGVRAVGIDRIIAEANVAKMTLYTHFPSKDDLILAVLKHREVGVSEFFRSAMERHGRKTKSPLRAFFAALKEWFESPGFRGCAFHNAAVELADPAHAGSEFVRGHKQRFGEFLRGLVEQTVGKSAAEVAPAVTLLIEGAIVTAMIQGTPDAADVARDAALKLASEERV
jgi:AcrR family transcriptional regulator